MICRFDREIEIPSPNMEARAEILKVHSAVLPLDSSINLSTLFLSSARSLICEILNQNEIYLLPISHLLTRFLVI